MILLPIRTSIWPRRTPYANYLLIVLNVLAFLITYGPHREMLQGQIVPVPVHAWAKQFMLTPAQPHPWQFVTYAFLHGGWLHIIGNMFFLYLFGNNVNDKLGHIGYLAFYLAGGVFSGIGHTLVQLVRLQSGIPILGASGAVAAVTGAYLALFPQTMITVFYWFFFFIGATDIPALYFIGFKMILIDNIIARYTPNVAYDAHLAGYAFGIAASVFLLATGLVKGSGLDLWAMIKRWNRRRQYREVTSSGYDPFTGRAVSKPIKSKELKKTPAQLQQEQRVEKLRNEITKRINQRNLPAAAVLYLELMSIDSKQILPRQHLLDIANQLASDNRPAESARAYEQFLTHYSGYEFTEQVELMVGILYSRYLHKPEQAVKHLQAAAEKLSDPGQLKMCKDELAKLQHGD